MNHATPHDRIRAILNAHCFDGDVEFDVVMVKLSEARVKRVETILSDSPAAAALLDAVESWQEFDVLEGLLLRLAEQSGWPAAALGIEPYLRR